MPIAHSPHDALTTGSAEGPAELSRARMPGPAHPGRRSVKARPPVRRRRGSASTSASSAGAATAQQTETLPASADTASADKHGRLVVLGSGTCVPNAERLPAGFWLELGGDVRIRIDLGPGTVHASTRAGSEIPWTEQSHQLITHFHLDHVGDLGAWSFAMKHGWRPKPRGPLHFHGPPGTVALFEGYMALLYKAGMKYSFELDLRDVTAGEPIDLAEGVRATAHRVPHTRESVGWRIDDARVPGGRSIGFTGDTSGGRGFDRLPAFFADVDLLVCECGFLEPGHKTQHLCASETAWLAQEAGAKALLVNHCYFDPIKERLAERLASEGYIAGAVLPAYDGQVLSLDGPVRDIATKNRNTADGEDEDDEQE